MKLFITQDQMDELSPSEKEFIRIWREHKKYNQSHPLSFGECVELLVAYSYNLHHEDSLYQEGESFFDNILRNKQSIFAWDGTEPIDILFYEAKIHIKKRLYSGRTFNDEEVII